MNYKNAYEELKKIYEKLEDKYIHNVPCCNEEDCGLFKEYQQLKDNWNKLKEWLEEELLKMNPQKLNIGEFNLQNDDMNMGRYLTIQKVNKLMQEIEGGMNE